MPGVRMLLDLHHSTRVCCAVNRSELLDCDGRLTHFRLFGGLRGLQHRDWPLFLDVRNPMDRATRALAIGRRYLLRHWQSIVRMPEVYAAMRLWESDPDRYQEGIPSCSLTLQAFRRIGITSLYTEWVAGEGPLTWIQDVTLLIAICVLCGKAFMRSATPTYWCQRTLTPQCLAFTTPSRAAGAAAGAAAAAETGRRSCRRRRSGLVGAKPDSRCAASSSASS